MKIKGSFIGSFLIITVIFLISCTNNGKSKKNSIKDIDGNDYLSVLIGNKEWLVQNLNVSHFRNGDLISEAKNADEWNAMIKENKPAFCYYNFDKNNGIKYGKLYNRYAITDNKGLAPAGFRVGNSNDWMQLIKSSGDTINTAKILKSSDGWSKNGNGLNTLGFSALPGGWCQGGNCSGLGENGLWWITYELNGVKMSYSDNYISDIINYDDMGLSVRCIKE